MGRYMRKLRAVEEVAMAEVSQAVGVRTRAMTTALARAARRRKAPAAAATTELQIAYLQLRSRSLVITAPQSALLDRGGGISRCASSASSCEASALLRDGPHEVEKDAENAMHCSFLSRRETTPSSNPRADGECHDLESTAEKQSPWRSAAAASTPSEAEIEEFFSAAEKKETQRFTCVYNYDVVKDVPLEGGYEWVRVHH